MIDAKTHLRSQVIKAVTVGDIAQLYTDFEGTAVDGSGKSVAICNKAIEVLRRHPDGSWKLIVGDPNGREC
jgi:ketosteroid isomerase-like protein